MVKYSIYWINLESRADRRRRCLKYFESAGITDNIRITPPSGHPPKISCCLAHADAILTAYRDGGEYAIIVEDDVQLDAAALKRIEVVADRWIAMADKDRVAWDCYQLHWIDPYLMDELVGSNTRNIFLKGYLMSSACYLMNREGMKRFLDKMGVFNEKGKYAVTAKFCDGAISEEFIFNYINTYTQLIPPVNVIEEGGSDVQSASINLEWNWRNMVGLKKLLDGWASPEEELKTLSVSWCGSVEKAKHTMECMR
jgi:GR25 family glycosyltransferase involved in LPS biosynthesis